MNKDLVENLNGKSIGLALTGSHCTLEKTINAAKELAKKGAKITPIVSPSVKNNKTRFGEFSDWKNMLQQFTEKPIWESFNDVEPIGPQDLFDLLLIAPCTGNSLAKLANGIIDTPVIMAAKSQLRNQKPVLIALATNDGLGINAINFGHLINTKNIYFVPLGQDNATAKPNSLVFKNEFLVESCQAALNHKQLQPVLVEYN